MIHKISRLLCLMLVMCFLFSGCFGSNKKYVPIEKQGKQMAEKIYDYFKNRDSEGLKSLFSEHIKETHDLDKELQDAFGFIDGDFVSFEYSYGVAGSMSQDGKGEVVFKKLKGTVKKIKTTTDKTYEINFDSFIISRDDESYLGINRIGLHYIDDDDERIDGMNIGEYYEESTVQHATEKIYDYFKNRDSEGLKSLFSEHIKETHDLDKEIQNAFDFIDGDFVSFENSYSGVVDMEQDENGKVVYKLLKGNVDKIKTTTNKKKYDINFDCFTIKKDDESYVGIDRIGVVALNPYGEEPLDSVDIGGSGKMIILTKQQILFLHTQLINETGGLDGIRMDY